MNAFTVYLDGKKIDTIFTTDTDADAVRVSLIEHDGYSPRIVVEREDR